MVKQCADLSSQAAEERTPSLPLKTNQPLPSTPSCMEGVLAMAIWLILLTLPMHLAFNVQYYTFQMGCGFKTPSACPENFENLNFEILSKRDFQFMRKFAPMKISRYTVYSNGKFTPAGLPRHPRRDVTYTAIHCVLMGKVH